MLALAQFCSVLSVALAGGMFWGPWLALTISIRQFSPEVFLALTDRLSRNVSGVMTVLLPLALLLQLPVLGLSYGRHPAVFACTLAALALFAVALFVTVAIEVPLVKQMQAWTVATLPPHWAQVRDRWASFHVARVGAAVLGLGLLLAGALAR